jgi:AcrR family transcriptional regulator
MQGTAGLRTRKKAETRHAIAAAALALATEHGPGDVTVEDIAAAANVSPRTVFNYFPTKEAAILGTDPERRAELLERLESRPADEAPLTALHEAFTEQFTLESALTSRTRALLAREHPALHRAYLASFAAFEDDLTAAMARRTGLDPHKDAYPRLVVAVALTAMRTAATHAIDLGRTADMPALIDEAFAAIAAGLTPPQAPPAA